MPSVAKKSLSTRPLVWYAWTARVGPQAGLLMLECADGAVDDASPSSTPRPASSSSRNNGAWGLVGASPDGLLRFSNGSLVVVEVKNHAPFQAARGGGAAFEVFDRGPMASIGAWHVPQVWVGAATRYDRITYNRLFVYFYF